MQCNESPCWQSKSTLLFLDSEYYVMGCTQYLDLAREHRSLVLIGLSFRGYVRSPLYSPLVQTLLLSLVYPPCIYTESLFTVLYGHPVVMGCTQYLDLAQEHRSSQIGLVRLKAQRRTNPFITRASLRSSFLLRLSFLYITDHCLLVIIQLPRDTFYVTG